MRFLTLPLIALAIACSMAQAQSAPTQQPATTLPGTGTAVQPTERPNGSRVNHNILSNVEIC